LQSFAYDLTGKCWQPLGPALAVQAQYAEQLAGVIQRLASEMHQTSDHSR
jgi:hypothetical protein